MITSNTSNIIGIEYLSWINQELSKAVKKTKAPTKKRFRFSNHIILMTILMLLSPYLIVGGAIFSLNILYWI